MGSVAGWVDRLGLLRMDLLRMGLLRMSLLRLDHLLKDSKEQGRRLPS